MAKYRKKPVVIEAFQMTRERRADNRDWPEWLNEAWQRTWPEPGAVSGRNSVPNEFPWIAAQDEGSTTCTDRLVISTPEGAHIVNWGDWIIRGVAGELYPCKPDIFEKTYELVTEES